MLDDEVGGNYVAGFHVKCSVGVNGVVVLGIVSIRDRKPEGKDGGVSL